MKIQRRLLAKLAIAFVAQLPSWLHATSPELFHPRGHDREGLPPTAHAQPVYDPDTNHSLNQLHRLLFIETLVPEEVHAELPSQRALSEISDEEFYVRGWYFQKLAGTESDRSIFGGDVRISPRRGFSENERQRLIALLQEIAANPKLDNLQDPLTRLMVQWDVLSVWWSLEKANCTDVELLGEMASTVQSLGQSAEVLSRLGSGIEDIRNHFRSGSPDNTNAPYFPADFPNLANPSSDWVEIARNSSQLFQADHSLRSSHVYLNAGTRSHTLDLIHSASAPAGAALPVPGEMQTVLIQKIVGIDTDLRPVATPVIDELRVRAVCGPAELSAGNLTSSHDGSNHWIFMRTRFGSTRKEVGDFRFVADTSQSLFTQYGTLKHATYAAQCALCHRRTHNGGQSPEGIRSLTKHAQARVALKNERAELAEQEMSVVVERLRQRIVQSEVRKAAAGKSADAIPAKRDPRPERSSDERSKWIDELRRMYALDPDDWPAPHVDESVQWSEIGLLPAVRHPAENPHTQAKEELGKILFFDPRLSGSGQIACASCHDPDLHWADGRTRSFGHGRTLLTRNAPTVRNVGHARTLFWDGRSATLEDQVMQVLRNPSEMRASEVELGQLLSQSPEYQDRFQAAFGGDDITLDRIAQAIACFERTIVGGRSRWDAYLKGKLKRLDDDELAGLDLFRREARCMNCHHGPLFSDGQLHDVGLSYYGRRFEDLGNYSVSGNPATVGQFRTPSLRDVTQTHPLMHNGLFELPGVLRMYNAGMPTLRRKAEQVDDPLFPTKSSLLQPLGLNKQDLSDLEAFLHTLEEPKMRMWAPDLPIISMQRKDK